MPDVLHKDKVTEVSVVCRTDVSSHCIAQVMRILLRNHGLNLSGVKSNLYTEIGRNLLVDTHAFFTDVIN